MRVADGEQRALAFHRQVQRDAGAQVTDIHVAADAPRRNDGMQPAFRGGNADRAGERLQRHLAAGAEGGRGHRLCVIAPDMQRRILELVGKQAEAGDVGGPAMAAGVELVDRHLQRIAGLRALDVDRSRHRIDPAEVEVRQRLQRCIRADLAAGGIQAFEQDGLAGPCRDRGRKFPVPAEIMLGRMDGVVARDAHDDPSCLSRVTSE